MTKSRFLFAAMGGAALMVMSGMGLGIGPSTAALATETGVQDQSTNDQASSDQGNARREMRAGNALEAAELERRFFRIVGLPICRSNRSGGAQRCIEYLRYDYDRTVSVYRFKYIQQGRVRYIDLDARSGRVLNRSR